MADAGEVQYISDADGNRVAAVVPIELWQEIETSRETAYLLESPAMRDRLLEAKQEYIRSRTHDDRLFGNRFAPEG